MRSPLILAINTSSLQFSIALARESGALVAEYTLASGKTGSRPLFPALHELLVRTGADLRDVRALAAATGPGSFTGLRVGLSAAKGLCRALGIPIIGVPSLQALASQWACTDLPICALLGSKKGEVFTSLFRVRKGAGLLREKEDCSLRMRELAFFVEDRAVFIGDDFDGQSGVIREILGSRADLAPGPVWTARASAVAAIAGNRLREGDVDDPETLVPNYLSAPDIRRNPSPVRS
ncbi:MAG: tRNA (adenosine(37)-N6)-threonylcarbamoyltransferase complex dimerization subunit type 1 TsaB [Thermodesulfobacteriota bacterium]